MIAQLASRVLLKDNQASKNDEDRAKVETKTLQFYTSDIEDNGF